MHVHISIPKTSAIIRSEIREHLFSLSLDVKEFDSNYQFRINATKLFDFVYYLKENSIPFHAEFNTERMR
jgi:hypothetical protein